ncbi:MAG: protein kinase, partial [Verrucomicrobiae bacterium]|nr:protein kinase [Verrucomicrobiae bacterium]
MPVSTSCHTCGSPLSVSLAGSFCPVCALRSVEDIAEEKASVIGDGSLPQAFGNFELLAELGRGGMGLVFKAQEPRLNRLVAVKVLLTGRFSDAAMRHRFQREAEVAASLQHPNIVAVHEVGEASGHPYLTMDFVDGPNLAELCAGSP